MIRRLPRYFPSIALALVFSVLPLQLLYGASQNSADSPSAPVPPLFVPDNGARTAAVNKVPKAAFAPDRIIVKFRDSVTESADMIHGSGARFAQFTATDGAQLDELNSRFGVTGITPLFQPQLRAEKNDGRGKSRAERKRLFAAAFNKAGARHEQRSARISRRSALPDLSHIYVVALPAGTDILAACRSYAANANVAYAVPSYAMAPQSVPNDHYFSSTGSWGNSYDDMWGMKKIRADLAWDTAQGEGVVVAVVDTGLDYNHADIAANVWTNTAEAAGTPGVDDDDNGYIDDIRGQYFDYVYPGVVVSSSDIMDRDGHGTFVAGIIGAIGNNGSGIIGVAPQAKIMPVKIMANNGFSATEAYANGILYAAFNGADVINLSWGCSDCSSSSGNPAVADAISTARGMGAVVVTSAGNWRSDVKDAFPAGIEEIITVAATDAGDEKSAFSNRGYLIDVAAPGGQGWYDGITANYSLLSLKSSLAGSTAGNAVDGTYLRSTGTSAAAAYVSGLAALVLSANPALTSGQVAAVIRQSADDQLGSSFDVPGYDPYFGWGRINAAQAVALALAPPLDPPLLRVPSDGFSFNIPQTLCGQERSFAFDIFNLGGGDLAWSLATPAWLTPLTASGSGNAAPVMRINASSPASGVITVSSNGAGAGTSDVPVSVAVRPDIKLTNCTMALSSANGNQLWDQPRNKNQPAVPDGSGGAYYVWFGPDSTLVGNYHVYMQHVDSNGDPLWTANGIRVSSSDKFQYNPTVVSDGTGGVIVLWIEGLNTGDYADKNFAAQRLNNAGELLWGSAGIAVTQGGNVVEPVIIADGSGGAIVGWAYLSGNGNNLYTQRISASGATLWQANGAPLSLAANDQFYLRAAADGSGGAWFVWVDNRNPFHDVYGQHLDRDGVPLWPQDGSRLNSQPLGSTQPNVVADGTGGAIAAWYDYRNHPMSGDAYYSSAWDIYAIHLDSSGQQLWSPAEALVAGGTTVTPWGSTKMLSDGQGGAVIAWLDHRNRDATLKENKEVFAQRINGAGQPLWSPPGVRVLAADGWDIAPTFIPDGDGGALFAWQDTRFGSLDILLQQLKADGSLRWGTNGIWAHSGSKDQTDPYLVPLGGNRLAITWNEWTNAFPSGVDFRGEIVQLCTDHDGDGFYAEGGVCGVINAGDPLLEILKTGPGRGAVQSLPSGINCGADCSRPFAAGSVITLKAVAAPDSFFRGWTGAGCSGTGDCIVTLTAATTVHANFAANLPVKIAENQAIIYTSPQHAYNNALTGNTIISRAYSFNETLTLKLPVEVYLTGGYDDDFVDNAGNTEITGLVVVDGKVTVGNIVIK